jgi:hemerythrin-like domain-containing protein
MSKPFQQLVTDHRNIKKLLQYLRNEVKHYDDALEDTDTARILEALDYLSDYPQNFHHPMEEVAMDLLVERNVGDKDAILKVRAQHQEIERETRKLADLFEQIYNDQIVPVSRIKEQLARYYDLQSLHLETEDKTIMPLFEKTFSEADWDWISCQVENRHDPLFFAPYTESFQELSQSLALR